MSTPETITILGRGSVFEGKLTFETTARVEGDFVGEVSSGGTFVVGPSARVRAEVAAAVVVVEGEIRGDITASSSVELRATGRVFGNITTPNLEIEKGSVFEGSCRMRTRAEDEVEVEALEATAASADA